MLDLSSSGRAGVALALAAALLVSACERRTASTAPPTTTTSQGTRGPRPVCTVCLDMTFGSGGLSRITGLEAAEGVGLALDSSGRILVAGTATESGRKRLLLARFDASGNPDMGFGSGGRVLLTIGNDVRAAALLIDDEVTYIAGTVKDSSGQDFVLAKINGEGALVRSTRADFGGEDEAFGATLFKGHILVAGATTDGGTREFAIASFDLDTALDTTFGPSTRRGRVKTSFGPLAEARAVAAGTSTFVVAGRAQLTSGGEGFALARYQPNGDLDTTFVSTDPALRPPSAGIGGKVVIDWNGSADVARAVAVASNGDIVVAGETYTRDNRSDVAIARLKADGALDTSFNRTGRVTYDNEWRESEEVYTLHLAADGGIVVGGAVFAPGEDYQAFAVGFDAAGQPEEAKRFVGGVRGAHEVIKGLLPMPDGKWLVTGRSFIVGSSSDLFVARGRPQ